MVARHHSRTPGKKGAKHIELYQAIALLVVVGCIIVLLWLFHNAMGGTASKTLISYEALALMLIIIFSLIGDYFLFQGELLIRPIFGQNAVERIHYVYDNMGNDMKIYLASLMSFIVICLFLVLYYISKK